MLMAKSIEGVVSGHKATQPEGKNYKLHDFVITDDEGNTETLKGVYSVPMGLADGMRLKGEATWDAQRKKNNWKFTAVGGPSAKAVASGKASSAGLDRDAYQVENGMRIGRQAAMNTAMEFVKLAVEQGAFTKKVTSNADTLMQVLFQYANLFEKAAIDGDVFKAMPQFTGAINEGGAAASEDTPE